MTASCMDTAPAAEWVCRLLTSVDLRLLTARNWDPGWVPAGTSGTVGDKFCTGDQELSSRQEPTASRALTGIACTLRLADAAGAGGEQRMPPLADVFAIPALYRVFVKECYP